MRLRTYIHHLHWNFLTWFGLFCAMVGLGWLLLAIPFESAWEGWITRSMLLSIGFLLFLVSRRRRQR